METINQIGTFDLENYGDLLYPILFRRIVEKRSEQLRIRHYSLVGGDAPQQAGFESYPIKSLFTAPSAAPSSLVVGGGDLLRGDCDVIAAHYRQTYGGHFKTARKSIGTASSLGYVLRKGIPLLNHDSFFAERFKRSRMNYNSAAPFLVDVTQLPIGSTVCYLSCGVPEDFKPNDRTRIAEVLDRAQFIYLRDEQSAEKLRRAGVSREIHVAPDLAVTLSEQFDHAEEARKGRRILSKLGLDDSRSVLCFQSKAYYGFREKEIIQQLNDYRRKTGSQVVLLPLGYCHNDHKFLRRLARQSGGVLRYADLHSIFDMISVIAASDMFVGTSLHGNITAFSFGTPHLFGPLPVDKTEGFLRVVGLPSELKLRSWAELNEKVEMATTLGRKVFSNLARKAQAGVHRVMDELFEDLPK